MLRDVEELLVVGQPLIAGKKIYTKRPNGSVRIQTISDEESRVQQQFMDEADINKLVNRFGEKPLIMVSQANPGAYGDFTNVKSYGDAYLAVKNAEEAFMTLPAAMRSRFDNDPGKLLSFLDDPKNLDEARRIGLIKPPPVPPEAAVSAPTPPAPGAAAGGNPPAK